ncbi:PAS domain S-box protein [uncultured Mucilaginibacter sp.]|uniref:PAS domain-containing sensor histidine kinase n=1 Tax=uncultured Mucilaginibacter sp. TaxID=797541 RepID=UPI0025F6785E|nr:PAS domain S-box protein [uncultured Mucilaginibacter sp.]
MTLPTPNQNVDGKLFSLLVASVKDAAIIWIDINGYILSWNLGAEHIQGYTENEIIGQHVSVFYQPNDINRKQLRNNLNQALKNGMYETEGWRVRKDGSSFWAHVVFTTLYNDNGHLIGFAKVTRDMTERKLLDDQKAHANAELERRVAENTRKILTTELRFRKLIENSYDGIALLDRSLVIFYQSMSAERISGWRAGDLVTLKMVEITHPDDADSLRQLFNEILAKPGVPEILTFRIRHKNGHYIWLESVFTNMLEDKNVKAIVCNFRNVTERKSGETERDKMIADLVQRNKDLEQFTYIVSHNLRAPVANITGLSALLNATVDDDPESQEVLQALSHSINNLDKVILDLNHILQAGSAANDKIETIDFPILIEEIRMSIHHLIEKNNAILIADFNDLSQINSLKSYIYSIFQNLITNSIKYRRADVAPLIIITGEREGDKIKISFKDNGKGINLSRHGNNLFGLYKRFDRSVEGKGMGLFMVKIQVERLGGTIQVQSEPEQGTEFIIQFPLNKK